MAYQAPLNGGRINATIGGNTAGAGSLVSTGTLTLVGGNNITLSQNGGNAITIDGGAGGLTSQSNQALSGSNGSFAFQTATFGNLNGMSFYTSNGSMVGSYTTPTQSNQNISLYALGNTTQNSSTMLNASNMSFNGLGGASVGFSNGSIQISGATGGAGGGVALYDGAASISSGTARISAGGALTASVNGQTLSLNAPAQSNLSATGAVSISNNGNTISIGAPVQTNQAISGSNGSFTFQTATLGNLNGMSFYTSNGSMVGSYTVPTQTAYSFDNGGGVSFGTNVSTVTASVATTYAASNHSHGNPTLSLTNLSGSTASASNGLTLSLSAAAQSAYSFANSNGVSFGTNVSTVTGSVATTYAASNHSHGNPTLNLTNISGTTASASNGLTLSLSAAAPGAGGGINIAASNTTFTSGTVVMSNNGGALTISSGAQSVLFAVPQTSSLMATGALSISVNVSTISIGAPAPLTWSYFNPRDGSPLTPGLHGQGSLHIQPAQFDNVQFDRIILPLSHSNGTNSSGSQTASFWVGIYTRNVSTLSLASSISTNYAVTASGTAGNYSLFGGQRLLTLGSTNTVSEGQYYIGIISRTTSGGANASISQLLVSQLNVAFSGVVGVASNATAQQTRGLGYYTASTTALPASIAFTEINGTASLALRQPAIYFVSQTF